MPPVPRRRLRGPHVNKPEVPSASAPATRSRHWLIALIRPVGLAISAVLGCSGARGAAPAETVGFASRALRVEEAPVLDGVLDDACWQNAEAITNFTQVSPREGEAPTERTEIRFVFDARNLYIAVRCFDSEPDRVLARELQRDAIDGDTPFLSDDQVTLILDPFHRERDGYLFAVNPLGAQADGRIENYTWTFPEWDGLWDARARIDEQGWTAELVIPFTTLSFNPANDTWGVNVERLIRRKDELVRWAAPQRSREGDSVVGIGEVRGLTELQQGRGWELRPYAAVRYHDTEADGSEWEFRPGLDASYLITPALTAMVTINTDFAEREVDARQINLSRFPLFFPEKREFFLRDQPYFSFGTFNTYPLFTRTIGLSPEGEPVDILAGAKLTGRIGGTTLGVFDVQQEAYDDVPSKNLFVARVTQEVLGESAIGMLATHGDPFTAGDNTLLGADFSFYKSELPGGNQVRSRAWFMHTDSDRAGGDDQSFGATFTWPNFPWQFFAYAGQVGEQFDPGMGFVERAGIREYSGQAGYSWELNRWGLQRIDVSVAPYIVTDLDNRVETENHELPELTFIGSAGDGLGLGFDVQREQLFEPFEIRPGIVIPAEDYRFNRFALEFDGATSRVLAPGFELSVGDFYDGTAQAYEFDFDWRPSRYVLLSVGYELTEVQLPAGSFDVRLATVRLNLALNPRLSWNTLAQYDNESDSLGINSRIRWTVKPGTDIYFVVNQGYAVEDDHQLIPTVTEATLKGGLTWRF